MQTLAEEAVAKACAARGIVVAAGGDGTIGMVARAALGKACVFGVLPQGTFNYFSRTHGIPEDMAEALTMLLSETPKAVQVGLVNDRVFLVNASLGLYARMLEEREGYKRRFGRHRWVAFAGAFLTVFKGVRQLDLRLASRGTERVLRTPTLFVGNNALQMERVGVDHAEAPEHGQLTAIAVEAKGTGHLVALMLRGAAGRLGESSQIRSFAFESVTIDRRGMRAGKKMKVALDGELSRFEMPLTIRVAPDRLWLLRPEVAPELEEARRAHEATHANGPARTTADAR